MADFVVERRNVDFHEVAETFTKYVLKVVFLNPTILVGIKNCVSQCDKVVYKNHGFSTEVRVISYFWGVALTIKMYCKCYTCF